jgi:hypothetical protein
MQGLLGRIRNRKAVVDTRNACAAVKAGRRKILKA